MGTTTTKAPSRPRCEASEQWWNAMDAGARRQAIADARRELGRDVSIPDAFRYFSERAEDRQLEPPVEAPADPPPPEISPEATAVENAAYQLVNDVLPGIQEAIDELRTVRPIVVECAEAAVATFSPVGVFEKELAEAKRVIEEVVAGLTLMYDHLAGGKAP